MNDPVHPGRPNPSWGPLKKCKMKMATAARRPYRLIMAPF